MNPHVLSTCCKPLLLWAVRCGLYLVGQSKSFQHLVGVGIPQLDKLVISCNEQVVVNDFQRQHSLAGLQGLDNLLCPDVPDTADRAESFKGDKMLQCVK